MISFERKAVRSPPQKKQIQTLSSHNNQSAFSSMSLRILIGIIIFVVSLIGLLLNAGVIVLSSRTSTFRSTFGLLIRNEAVGAALFSVVFMFYVAPVLTFDIIVLQGKELSARFGLVAILSHDVCLFSHTCISINRFIAAYLPNRYSSIYTTGHTRFIVVCINVLAVVLTAVHYIEPCWLFFSFPDYFFQYDQTDCGRILSLDIQFPRNIALICICSFIDLCTFVKLRIHNRNLPSMAQAEQKRRQKVELALISQVCAQAAMYIIEFVTYFIVSSRFSDPFFVFMLTTFAWGMVHTTDGLAVFLFNKEMRRALITACGVKTTKPTATSSLSLRT